MTYLDKGCVLIITLFSFCVPFALGNDYALAMKILKQYNYLGESHPDPRMKQDEMFGEALRDFQAFAGLNVTGVLDQVTLAKLTSRRCGVADVIDKGSVMKRRRKRYALAGSKWVGVIGYRFKKYSKTSSLRPAEIQKEVERALSEWSKHAPLRFKAVESQADIELTFERNEHGDGSPFDGAGMVLAHAFFPSRKSIGGDLHFDDDENWTINSDKGVDLYYVALHELGHSLGLQHSADKGAVMHPFYAGYRPDLALAPDDIKGIRAIYGINKRIRPVIPPNVKPGLRTQEWKKRFCEVGRLDAVGVLNKMLVVFQGEFYAMLDRSGIAPGYPRRIHDDWADLPDDVDAAMSLEEDGILLVFKDTKYWRYTWNSADIPLLAGGYPRLIEDDFRGGLPHSVDATYRWSGNGRTYVVKDDHYYRIRQIAVYDRSLRAEADCWHDNCAKSFSDSWNLHEPLSDGLEYEGRTFFFAGTQYYRFNDNKYKADGDYPRDVASSWLGCGAGSVGVDMELAALDRDGQFDLIPVSRTPARARPAVTANALALLVAGCFSPLLT